MNKALAGVGAVTIFAGGTFFFDAPLLSGLVAMLVAMLNF